MTKDSSSYQQNRDTIQSDLSLPTEDVFLDRPALVNQIEEAFKGSGAIRLVALVGGGGAGKTTLARQYARQQSEPLIWEINAETKETLVSSFEVLAQVLAKTEEEKKNLKDIQESHNPEVKNNKILLFVKERLKALPSWLLLYDNIESLMDIRSYVPQDEKTWGRGKVLITTRNSHIQSNTSVHALPIDILTSQEKRALFTKILDEGNVPSQASAQQTETQELLNELPPFPLDVSVAAYYLKSTQISPETYRQHLHLPNSDFVAVQENILQETGEYLKTRYEIITLSLQELMKIQKDFEDLLLIVSLVGSQQIPRSLLEKLKDPATVDHFLYHLKKYSLMSYDQSSTLGTTFSLHRSTQATILAYLSSRMAKNNLQEIGISFVNYLNDLLKKENMTAMKLVIHHCEAYSKKYYSLFNSQDMNILKKLGIIYFNLYDYDKAKKNLELSISNSNTLTNDKEIALNMIYLGNIYRDLNDFQKAKQSIEKGYNILKNYFPDYPLDIAWAAGNLGNVYRSIGDYQKSKEILERTISLYGKHLVTDPIRYLRIVGYLAILYKNLGLYREAISIIEKGLSNYEEVLSIDPIATSWIVAYLADVNTKLGNYKESRKLLEKSLLVCEKNLPNKHEEMGWVTFYLGNLNKELGEYTSAKEFFDKALYIFQSRYNKNHLSIAWTLNALGNVHMSQKNYELGKKFIEQSLNILKDYFPQDHIIFAKHTVYLGDYYKNIKHFEEATDIYKINLKIFRKHYGDTHLETVGIMWKLGQLYLLEGKLKAAEDIFHEVLKIFQKHNHPNMYFVYEDLAELYHQKALSAQKEGNKELTNPLQAQRMDYLKKAHEGMKTQFPETSAHLIRIQSKLKKLTSQLDKVAH